jgi:hypothetical protein
MPGGRRWGDLPKQSHHEEGERRSPRRPLIGGCGDAISSELFGNVRRDALCGDDVVVSSVAVAGPQLGNAAAEQRRRLARIVPNRRIIIGEGVGILAQLGIDQAAMLKVGS